ncbi:MAG: hypothetical protein F8N37_23235 [Telmatospirillum sp.]|nr:hypothetical protein [Telmatospirillum sp.]
MAVRVLAFFDSRYQTSTELQALTGEADPWRGLREGRPLSRQHPPLNTPTSLGYYDLSNADTAARVVGLARYVGIDGFVIDCSWSGDHYVTGSAPVLPFCDHSFTLAYRWRNDQDPFWQAPAAAENRSRRAAALIAALSTGPATDLRGRRLVILASPDALHAPTATLALLREEAQKAGWPGIYFAGTSADGTARFLDNGFDAALDPGPADWQPCPPENQPAGFEFLEAMAGLRDSVDFFDRFYSYGSSVVLRMMNRGNRGKVFPCVFPAYHDWLIHQDGGATNLIGTNTQLFIQFLENAITFSRERFGPDESVVFLQSWNGWNEGSQIEPSLLDGDLIFNATRNAIDRARYTERSHSAAAPIDQDLAQRSTLLCDALRVL